MLGSGYLALALFAPDPFRKMVADPERLAELKAHHPRPPKLYCVMLTPRSGSSRLADMLARTERLGHPREYFNPANMSFAAQSMAASTLDEYAEMLPRLRAAGGDVFGMRITYRQMLDTFRREERFHRAFQDAQFFWLIREDIVAQAISASRMTQTDLRHLEQPTPGARERADAQFRYRPLEFRMRVSRMAWMEARTEAFFARYGIQPVRLSYEGLLGLSPLEVAKVVADPLGVDLPDGLDPASPHAPVSTGKSRDFAERFRRDHARFLNRIRTRRAPTLDALRR